MNPNLMIRKRGKHGELIEIRHKDIDNIALEWSLNYPLELVFTRDCPTCGDPGYDLSIVLSSSDLPGLMEILQQALSYEQNGYISED